MRKRVWRIREAGISKKAKRTSPFWLGERAEDIVARRVRQYNKEKKLAALKRKKRAEARRNKR